MKKLVLVAVFLLGFSVLTMAQDVPKAEIFGGYSLVMIDTETASGLSDAGGVDLSLNGWNASIAFNGSKWLGFVADFGGYYGSICVDQEYDPEYSIDSSDSIDVHMHSILIGPRIALHRGAVTPFVQSLFGYAHITAKSGGESVLKENDFAMLFGGGIDVNLKDRVALRPVQLDYFTTKAGTTGNFADHFRFSTGVVIKLGKK